MPYLHLTPGSTLLPDGDGLLLVTADESFAAVTGQAEEIPELQSMLRGESPMPKTGTAADVAQAIVEWGAASTGLSSPAPAAPWSLAELVDGSGIEAKLHANGVAATTVVSDVLDDTTLQRYDDSTTWLPVHRELGNLVVGPVLGPTFGPVSDATPLAPLIWADVRFRRLAASPTPHQLEALWRHWSEHGAADDVLPAADQVRDALDRLVAWLPTHPGVLARHQLVVRLYDDSEPSAHPVLPVPAGLMEQVPA